eukprot:7126121-Prymnesium_polylepis.1
MEPQLADDCAVATEVSTSTTHISAAAVGKEISKYWQKLYAKQPLQPGHQDAQEECIRLLEEGNQVLPPTAERCGAHIRYTEVQK